MLQKVTNFLLKDVWRIRAKKLPKSKFYLIRLFRTILLSLRGFHEDKCFFRASALTFYTLLSIVPLFAMLFGIAKGFGFEKMLETRVMENIKGQEEVMLKIIDFSRNLLDQTSGGIVAGIGIAFLFWAVIKMLGNIEISLNDIWGVKKARTMGRKFSDYLSFILICPVLIILSSSVTVFVTTQITLITQKIALLGFFTPLIHAGLNILPYGVIWVLFTFIYIFMPNTKVNFLAGLTAGIVAGSLYQMVQWIYITFQINVAKYGAIYGSFAALPLFLIWLQVSWLIVLFGAELSFAIQNEETYEFEPDCEAASRAFKKRIALAIAHQCVKNFASGEKPMTASQISHLLELPIRLVRDVINDLVDARVLSDTNSQNDREKSYQPAQDIEGLTVKKVLDSLDHVGTENVPLPQTEEFVKINDFLIAVNEDFRNSKANVLLKNI